MPSPEKQAHKDFMYELNARMKGQPLPAVRISKPKLKLKYDSRARKSITVTTASKFAHQSENIRTPTILMRKKQNYKLPIAPER